MKYYNNCLFYNIQRDFLVQTGDPTNTGQGGDSIYGILYGDQARFFEDEIRPHIKHKQKGTVAMASGGPDLNNSQFYITTADALHSLDERHTIFGQVAEGLDILEAINDAPCDADGRPLQNIRIRHTIILDDPTPDPPNFEQHIPEASPPLEFAQDGRLEDDWVPAEDGRPTEEVEAATREAEAKNRAVVLEMIGDLPEADVKPPENMLFVCKLNQVTTEEDLEIIFSRFGTITSCDIIRDWKTGDSLCYAFIGFETEDSAELAYFKMHNVLIDDRRIKVDFSQSVSHLWKQYNTSGKKGDAGLAHEANAHHRQQTSVRGLELKDKYSRERGGGGGVRSGGGGGGGSYGGNGGNGGRYGLVLEEDEDLSKGRRNDGDGERHHDRDRKERRGGDRRDKGRGGGGGGGERDGRRRERSREKGDDEKERKRRRRSRSGEKYSGREKHRNDRHGGSKSRSRDGRKERRR
jgi:peptidyl-prolyl cis-trans isomerase-like 4